MNKQDNNPHVLEQKDSCCFDPMYAIDKDGNIRIIEISIIHKPTE